MKYFPYLPVAFLFVVLSCGKDKFTTEPQVTIKSISPSTVTNGDIIAAKGSYTDQEGDIDSTLIVYKWYNGTTSFLPLDTFRYSFDNLKLPGNTSQADIVINFQYNTFNPNGYITLPGVSVRDTSATIGLILIDKKGNRSNFSESEKIRLIKP